MDGIKTIIDREHKITVIAIHGGTETGTYEIANAIANDTFNFYGFEGERRSSVKFKDRDLAKLMREVCVSVHSNLTDREIVYVGGDDELSEAVKETLRKKGFTIPECPKRLAGKHPENIVNRYCKGVQLEIGVGLMDKLRADRELYAEFSQAVAEGVGNYAKPFPISSIPYTKKTA